MKRFTPPSYQSVLTAARLHYRTTKPGCADDLCLNACAQKIFIVTLHPSAGTETTSLLASRDDLPVHGGFLKPRQKRKLGFVIGHCRRRILLVPRIRLQIESAIARWYYSLMDAALRYELVAQLRRWNIDVDVDIVRVCLCVCYPWKKTATRYGVRKYSSEPIPTKHPTNMRFF